MDFKSITKLNNLSVSDFKKKFLEKRKPIIISNSFDWQATQKWNIEYLKALYPEKSVILPIFSDEPAEINKEIEALELKLPEALDLIYNNSDQSKKYYLMQQSMYKDFPDLLSDIALPKYADKQNKHVINLWLGEAGVNTRPHYDTYNNFLTQIVGRKRVRLFAPTDSHNMYPYAINDDFLGNNSPVYISRIRDTDLVNDDEFPNLNMVTCFEGILYPGDLLFIPAGWWHEVKSLDISISVNFWWKIKIENFSQQSTNLMCSFLYWYSDNFDEVIRDHFDFSEFQDDIQIAEAFLLKGLKCIAAFFLLNYFHKIFDYSKKQEIAKIENEIPKWKEYLEVAKNENDSLLEDKKIMYIINKIKSYNV